MERAMSVEERIRRAEDIYNRRNGGYSRSIPNQSRKEKNIKSKKGNVKKLFMQIFIVLSIYVIFYAVTNREYVFSEEFRNEVNTFFTEKTKISEWYSSVKGFIQSKFTEKSSNENNSEGNTTDGENNEEKKEDNSDAGEEKKEEQKSNQGDKDIGGAVEGTEQKDSEESNTNEQKKEEQVSEENLSEQQLMEKDAKEIKEKISFIAPIAGRISSTFGWRNPTTASVPKYHTGLDIAAKEGTVIKSATDGKIILASSKGDYGNHYQIQVNDVIIVYAHCKKLYLKQGDTVKQGQEIAEVGTTGNSTGPHLHFEIRKGDRKIDPQLVLDI